MTAFYFQYQYKNNFFLPAGFKAALSMGDDGRYYHDDTNPLTLLRNIPVGNVLSLTEDSLTNQVRRMFLFLSSYYFIINIIIVIIIITFVLIDIIDMIRIIFITIINRHNHDHYYYYSFSYNNCYFRLQ